MIFAVGKEIYVVTKIMILIIKLLRMRAGIYNYVFSTSRLERSFFLEKRLEKGSFLSKRGWNFLFVTARGWKWSFFSWKKDWKKGLFLSKRGWNFLFVTAGRPVLNQVVLHPYYFVLNQGDQQGWKSWNYRPF